MKTFMAFLVLFSLQLRAEDNNQEAQLSPKKEGYQTIDMNQFKDLNKKVKGVKFKKPCTNAAGDVVTGDNPKYNECVIDAKAEAAKRNSTEDKTLPDNQQNKSGVNFSVGH